MDYKSYLCKKLKKSYVYITLIFILFITVLILNKFYLNEITTFDNKILTLINTNFQNNFITSLMKVTTFFGSYTCLISLIIIFLIIIKDKKLPIFMAFNLLLVYLTNVILKHIYLRERPSFPLVIEKGFSLPSSHAMCSIAFYGLLIYFIQKYTKNKIFRYILTIFFVILILLIGFSRLYLNVHYMSDVLIGYLFGLLSLLLFIKINNESNEQEKK